MLFHTFCSQKVRREFGGSYFIEFQYCKSEPLEIETVLSVIKNWQDDSLYIYGDDDNDFFACYHDIFTDGVYENGKTGVVDLCGINYYSAAETQRIIKKLEHTNLPDQNKLMQWLERAQKYSGFYILGL